MSPWESRKRGGLYYTRSRKEGGRVVREYVGIGPLAELAAHRDAEERRRREEAATVWKEEREHLEALDGLMGELFEGVELLVEGSLLAAGYHRHDRGDWRKRREPTDAE